jgi:hypothetical protein
MPTAEELISKALHDRAATVTQDTLRYRELRHDAEQSPVRRASSGPRRLFATTATIVAVFAIGLGVYALRGGGTHPNPAGGNANTSTATPTVTLAPPASYCLQHITSTRTGTDARLVPATPYAVTICANVPARPAKTVTDITDLVHALDALPTSPAGNGCQARGPRALPAVGTFELHFHYQTGRDVLVNVIPQCQPSINNQRLQADSSTTIVPLIEAALSRS